MVLETCKIKLNNKKRCGIYTSPDQFVTVKFIRDDLISRLLLSAIMTFYIWFYFYILVKNES